MSAARAAAASVMWYDTSDVRHVPQVFLLSTKGAEIREVCCDGGGGGSAAFLRARSNKVIKEVLGMSSFFFKKKALNPFW
jgi:hypothetical protein